MRRYRKRRDLHDWAWHEARMAEGPSRAAVNGRQATWDDYRVMCMHNLLVANTGRTVPDQASLFHEFKSEARRLGHIA